MAGKREKIAIIGGGVGAITAAYAITDLPDWQERYEITLYQLGWRLGGKGASGRNMALGGRIEEHGLHIWAGFYDNAFRLMRDCYAQLNETGLRKPEAPLGTLEKAFSGLNHFLIADEVQDGGKPVLSPWRFDFFPNDDKPGSGGALPTPFAYFQMLAGFIAALAGRLTVEAGLAGSDVLPRQFHAALGKRGLAPGAATPLHHLRNFAKALDADAFAHTLSETQILQALARHAQDWFRAKNLGAALPGNESRRLGLLVDLSLAFFRGAIDSGLFRQGFDAIDDWEISDWLLQYGASREAVDSAIFRGCYDYVFGYPGGVTDHRSVGAGTAIRGLLRLAFTYKGALFYKMMAGMGDTIFAPYFLVLKHRGVRFRFFNAARRLVLDREQTGIAAIDMVEQAEMKSSDYAPLVDVEGLPCWPSEPLWDEIKGGAALRKRDVDFESERQPPSGRAYRLQRGRDFDQVVLGASLGSLPYLATELIAAAPRWRKMVEKVGTVATHAAQFWVDATAEELGWNRLVAAHNSGSQTDLETVITSFAEPLDTWADMSDLLPREAWPGKGPKSIAYFCSPCPDAGLDRAPFEARVREWANSELVRMWPKAGKAGTFDARLLHRIGGGSGEARFAAQYFRENLHGSERYVLSVPGSVQYRLAPDDSGFDNLYLAGDWTRCGINAGCVEAATISGLAAARGLTGANIEIVGEIDLGPEAGPGDKARLASPYAQNAPWPLTPFFGTGQIDGFFSFHAVNAEALRAVLPAGMDLHPQALTPAGTHPVALLANRQIGVRGSFLPRFLGYRDYLEAIIAINWVTVEGHEGVFSYLPNLYLNSRPPQLAGVWLYGYNKRMGRLEMANNRYSVAGPEGGAIWSGRYQQKDFARPLVDFPQAGAVQALSEQVVVTRGKLCRWQFSSFDFNLTSAIVAPIAAEIEIADATRAEPPAGAMRARPLGRDHPGADIHPERGLPGAFRIWTTWTLSNPLDSMRIARLEGSRTRLP